MEIHMPRLKKGDRILALDGVCKGALGVVKGHGSPSTNYKSGHFEDIYLVLYDNGMNDSIWDSMLELVEDDPLNID
jgi:hypothetical protein